MSQEFQETEVKTRGLDKLDLDLEVYLQSKIRRSKLSRLTPDQTREWMKCKRNLLYFVNIYCKIYQASSLQESKVSGFTGSWVPFALWPLQEVVLKTFNSSQLSLVLKARQLGLTWLALAYALWLMIFYPVATILLFSRRDDESVYLLSDERLRGMFTQLPEWMREEEIKRDGHTWTLGNGSTAKAFSTSGGDSYTATLAIVDEADLLLDLDKLMSSVKPTIDGGGKMIMVSRVDKSRPNSPFKKIYLVGKEGLTNWATIFLPWHASPRRTQEWYEEKAREILQRTGAKDELWEQYPATDAEALAPRSLDKRIPSEWLLNCFQAEEPLDDETCSQAKVPSIPGLRIYRLPEPGKLYVLGLDPAEGNPTSDDSPCQVVDLYTGEQVAVLQGKFEPGVLGSYSHKIGVFYNHAVALCERNNHGHAVILWFRMNSHLELLLGMDFKDGWNETKVSKAYLYDHAADCFRDKDTLIHDFQTFVQLSSIEGSTLQAPEGDFDDLAVSYALCLMGRFQYFNRPERTLPGSHSFVTMG